ncbi:dTDP-4-dehydrorhamnose 3,5-epimerase [Faunimonas pinastri]|uniref:dTDP-4-dehydrorhamnose 3,5-epimerase n=1 Tax=Faunimonas pinastri TaxID=1855383 RepID=A0A1H9D5U7_9HYPH|nr:dTDP-4-dehydrorhamnose 3,5-epimerase [Faunimonas pinastri]SEQ08717.1 dTDP-4-dehydrorhamnose 3,5-epimerase [Faunimonas pinastri]
MSAFTRLAIPDVILVAPTVFSDNRGTFCEIYSRQRYEEVGIAAGFVQDNESLSIIKGTVRGLHFQTPPFDQAKLVRVVSGSIFDVAVDLRRGSPTYGRWVGATLTADKGEQLFIPRGFAHGFCTLKPETRVLYKVDNGYSREHDAGIRWNDPDLAVDWPLGDSDAVLSDRDLKLPGFAEFQTPFEMARSR